MAKIFRRPDSPYVWGRFTHKGKEYRQSLDTTSDRIAEKRLLEWQVAVKAGKWVAEAQRHSWEAAANKFIDEHFPRIKPNSAKRYRVSLQNWHSFFEDQKPKIEYLDEITSAVLSDFEHARRKKGVTNGTIRRDFMCLASLFSCAEDWEWVAEGYNPARKYVKKAEKRGLVEAEPRRRIFSRDEEYKVLSHIRRMRATVKGNRDKHAYMMLEAIVVFGIDAGLRAEEMLDLTWDKIDLEENEVTIHWTVAKSSRGRVVPILPRSQTTLRALKRNEHSNFVFWCRDGKRYTHMYQQLIRVCTKLGIESVEFHDLRRTCGARLLRDHRLSIERVQLWLGHESVQQTPRAYAFLEVDDLHLAVSESPLLVNRHDSGHTREVITADRQKKRVTTNI